MVKTADCIGKDPPSALSFPSIVRVEDGSSLFFPIVLCSMKGYGLAKSKKNYLRVYDGKKNMRKHVKAK